MRNELKTLITAAAVLAACGDSGGRQDTDSATGNMSGVSLSSPVTDTAVPTTGGTIGASEGTTVVVTEGGNSNGESQVSQASQVSVTVADTESDPKFDLGVLPDGGIGCGGGGGGQPDFSYIWVANSTQGTISKIDTQTMVELGRYIVRPDSAGSPSRTSVNLSGDVVVANRNGGLTKVYAQSANCADTNGMPGIQTATDANYLAWGVEECIAWYTPMNYISQRPAAWTQGTFNKATCKWENQKVWTSGNNDSGDNLLDIILVNGDTGMIEATINVAGVTPDYYGIYGGAVDQEGNFWGSQLSLGHLLFVDAVTHQYKLWPMVSSGYGMTVDSKGYVWTCSSNASRFDPMTETWQTAPVGGSGGCMEDGNGTLYMSGSGNSIIAVDTETLAVKQTLAVPLYVHGISIDFYGYVWGVSMGTEAYRVDPITTQYQTFTGLVGAYTYSDMTGFALSNVGQPSG